MLTQEEHQQKHKEIHESLDRIVASFILHTNEHPSEVSLWRLMMWASEEARGPGHEHKED